VSYEGVPGFVEEKVAYGETTVVIERTSLREAARHFRDELGFNFLADLTPTDYLGWGRKGVAGYWGTGSGRDINAPGSWGLHKLPDPKPKRFSVSYHLLALPNKSSRSRDARGQGREAPRRVRLQVWCDDGEPVPSIVTVWPTADWHEREAWDMMGIAIEGHPNLARILMEDDWEGHPLRKDYPLGGEPVRFSSAE
jgi:NADH:ubiquinone oxidoreductase subunit C